ncbi:hypothetical protein BDY24DRAFT_444832 [Mrakia frigida]|uniref:uncharacterized protein n=1 Tax=Mrakia frigida TaxID=29902 RepID=UPI003FCC202B
MSTQLDSAQRDLSTPTHTLFAHSSPSPSTPTPSLAPFFLSSSKNQPANSPHLPRTTSDPSLDSPLMATDPPTLSRTIAILLPHAFDHRTAIVKRFREAGFEIKDEFAWDADPVVLEMDLGVTDEGVKRAFVGDDEEDGGAHGGEETSRRPCHVWCLERRRVVEVMTALVGSENIQHAKDNAPTSLRALYGSPPSSIVLWTPTSLPQADPLLQLFFSSLDPVSTTPTDPIYPPHLTTDPHDFMSPAETDFVGTPEEADVASFRPRVVGEGGGAEAGLGIRDGTELYEGETRTGGGGAFKARPAPATTHQPERAVRQSRASLLRTGVDPSTIQPARTRTSSGNDPSTFNATPGHKRSQSNLHIDVASVRPPAVAVRQSRASLIRQGSDVPPPRLKRAPSSDGHFFVDTPGHKQVGRVIDVESTKRPEFEPRQTKASALRAGGGNGESVGAKKIFQKKTGEEIREERREEENLKRERRRSEMPIGARGVLSSMAAPSFTPRPTKASLLRTGGDSSLGSATSSSSVRRPSLAHQRSSSSFVSNTTGSLRSNASSGRPSSVAESRRPRPSLASAFSSETAPTNVGKPALPPPPSARAPVASTRPPSVTPRPNRAALLRQGQPLPPPTPRTHSKGDALGEDYNPFANTPGHRRQSIAVTSRSTHQPDIVPRQNRAQMLRMGGATPSAPSSFTTTTPTPHQQRARPASSIGLSSSTTSVDRPPSSNSNSNSNSFRPPPPPGHKRTESLYTPQPPSIQPRLNRAATLRQGRGERNPPPPPPSAFNKSFSNNKNAGNEGVGKRSGSAMSATSSTTTGVGGGKETRVEGIERRS